MTGTEGFSSAGDVVPGNVVYVAFVVDCPTALLEPVLRRMAGEPGIDLTAYYSRGGVQGGSARTGVDGAVRWEMPLLQGYKYKILPRLGLGRGAWSGGYLRQFLAGRYDVVWVEGPLNGNSLHALLAARMTKAKTVVRAEQGAHGVWIRRLMDVELSRIGMAEGESPGELEVEALWSAIRRLGVVGRRPF